MDNSFKTCKTSQSLIIIATFKVDAQDFFLITTQLVEIQKYENVIQTIVVSLIIINLDNLKSSGK